MVEQLIRYTSVEGADGYTTKPLDYCAQCGGPLWFLPHGARAQCCQGLGYWSWVAPLPKDRFRQRTVKAPDGVVYYRYIAAEVRRQPGDAPPTHCPRWQLDTHPTDDV